MREMKETGISWFPLIPADWQTGRIKDILSVLTDYTANGSFGDLAKNVTYLDYEDYARLVRLTDLRENLKNMGVYVDENGYSYLSKSSLFGGEILVANVGAYAGLFCEMPTVDYPATLAPNMFLLRTNDVMLQHYLLYVGLSSFVWEQLCQKAISSAQPKLNKTDVKTTFIPIPPISEQRRIADYLDIKCAQFDSTISDIQSQIEALEEYKRSVITEAVTKGLNPDVEMRDSGVQWIGDIPAHWITHPLYFYFGVRKNKNALGLETNLLSLSYGKIIRKDINSNGGLLPESFNTYNIIEKDDIIIRPTDLQNDKRSLRTGIAREHGIITSAYIAMKAIKTVNPEYFHYLLHAYDVMKVFYNMGNGVRQGLNFSEFSRLMVFEPAIEEQNAIVSYLKEKCDEIDLAIAEKKQQIETIEEYKKSLIFEYVTGKKEVQA
jgi:type I restriction enzyme S subunit